MNDKEQKTVKSILQKNIQFLESPYIQEHLQDSDFCFDDMFFKKTTVFLVMPAERLQDYKQMVRLWISSAFLQAQRTGSTKKPWRTLFLLDEVAQLGKMNEIKTAITLLRGYGITVWTIWQSLGQVKEIYGDGASTIRSSSAVLQFFGISDNETAEEVSKLAGMSTITVTSRSRNQDNFMDSEKTISTSETGRMLITPDEVRSSSKETLFVFAQGIRPIRAVQLAYFQNHIFLERSKMNTGG